MWRIVNEFAQDNSIGKDKSANLLQGDQWNLTDAEKELRYALHHAIKKVTEDIKERFNFNTAISAIMELVNALYSYREKVTDDKKNFALIREAIEKLVIMLAPFIPYAAEELGKVVIGKEGSVHNQNGLNMIRKLTKNEIEIVIQINGKVRDKIMIETGLDKAQTEMKAMSTEKAKRLLEGKNVVKVIVVPEKLVNIVVK